jgi:hypothetical protein
MVLNFGLDVSFENMQYWKGTGEKAVEVDNTSASV